MNTITTPSFARGLLRPAAMLALASAVCCAILVARIGVTGRGRHLFLVWNLFLAWLPLVFAVAAWTTHQAGGMRRLRFGLAALSWLLFFPNAPYILTDITHIGSPHGTRYWPDLVLILMFALTGLVLGFLSLLLMQRLVAQRFGWPAGWLFVAGVAALSGWGVFLGRCLRWNSWDAFLHPSGVLGDVLGCLMASPRDPSMILIPVMFGALLFMGHALLYALTRIPTAMPGMTHTARPSIDPV